MKIGDNIERDREWCNEQCRNLHSEWHLSKNLQTINAGEGAEKKEPSYIVGGMQTSTATMENSVETP